MSAVHLGSESVKRTPWRVTEFLHHVSVDHRRLDIRVSQVLLDLPDIDAVEQQVRCETVPQRILTLLMNLPRRSSTIVTIRFTANP